MATFTDDEAKQIAALSAKITTDQTASDIAETAVTDATDAVAAAQTALAMAQWNLARAHTAASNASEQVIQDVQALLAYISSILPLRFCNLQTRPPA